MVYQGELMNRRDILKTLTMSAVGLSILPVTLTSDSILKIGDTVKPDLDKIFQFILGHPATPEWILSADKNGDWKTKVIKNKYNEADLPLPESVGFDDIAETIDNPKVYAERICDIYEESGNGKIKGFTYLQITPHKDATNQNIKTLQFCKVEFPKIKIKMPDQWVKSKATNEFYVWNTTIYRSFLIKI